MAAARGSRKPARRRHAVGMVFVLTAWLLQSVLGTLAVAIYRRQMRRPQPWPAAWPPVLVLVPVRGDAGLDGFLAALAAQDHPRWRVVFAIEDAADPAAPALARFVAAMPKRASLVVAGIARRRGQKVHNLLAGLACRVPEDAAIVTLDADTVPQPDLLRTLLRPLATDQAPIATGYRWTVAADHHSASRAIAAIDQTIATLPPLRRFAPCWGGATAIRADALELLDLPSVWDQAVADDLTLSRAARRRGLRVYGPLGARVLTPVRFGWRSGLAFGQRQYRLLRLHAPGLWLLAAATAWLPPFGGAAAWWLVAEGDWRGTAALLLAVALGAVRWRLRRSIAPAGRASLGTGPVAVVLRLLALAGSFGRSLTWAARRYRLSAAGAVETC